uniref:ATP synthase F0 subunit 8 n=1 Tax=Synorthocladius bifidus TaxID=3095015 RepID=UPI002E790671|nr:ATP synthase F0 subunit 8 [Synorthocladius bifidus]WPM93117.1 ATP synthase F0 subunit 8 [Synorthocladius bifidus]
MPQMAPISWLILFIIFSMAFLSFNVLNYFCYNNKKISMNKNSSMNKNNYKNLNWKW